MTRMRDKGEGARDEGGEMREKGGGVGSERVEVGQVYDKGDVVCG